jgi:hypothetical protein
VGAPERTTPPTDTPSPGTPPPAGTAPVAEAVVRRRRVEVRQKRTTRWMALVTGVAVLALAALAFVGYKATLRISGGSAEQVTDPDAPGYLAEPRPSEVDLFVVTRPDGTFASALLAMPSGSGDGGTLTPLPGTIVVPEYEGAGAQSVQALYDEGGLDALRERLGVALSFRIRTAEVVPAEAVAALAGVEPVTVESPDDLVERSESGEVTTRYRAGEVTLQPEEVVDFLAFAGADDPSPNQALRAQAVWEQLLPRAAAVDPAALPRGEATEGSDAPGFGETVSRLVAGEAVWDQVPLADVPVPGTLFVAWMPDAANLQQFVARSVPLPQSPVPGIRVPVRLRNGTDVASAASAAVPVVVGAGGEVLLIGNADSFDVATTTVGWKTPGARPVAEAIAAQLGVTAGPLEETADLDGAVVDVVIGADRAG